MVTSGVMTLQPVWLSFNLVCRYDTFTSDILALSFNQSDLCALLMKPYF